MRVYGLLYIAALLILTGCPRFENEYSGRYREVPTEERRQCFERRECTLMEVDLFRFGDFSQAILREFEKGPRNTTDTPFVELTRCGWTRADRFRTDQTFSLAFERQAGGFRGELLEEQLRVTMVEGEDEGESFTLKRIEDDPQPDCSAVGDYPMAVSFQGEMPAQSHAIENPVFVVLWLGLERIETPGGTVYTGTQGFSTFLRLPKNTVNAEGYGLTGRIDLIQVTPPDDRFLANSGLTSFAVGHFVVVDDAEDSGRFLWSRGEEPIIATTVKAGVSPQSEWTLDSPYSGQALLFVRDSLMDLDPALRERIVNLDGYAYPNQNFYIVDIVADGRDILEITLPERRIPSWPKLSPTTEFLNQTEITLPRLFPFVSQ